MDDAMEEQPAKRERVGSHAWVRTVGLVGGGLMAGGILAGTLTANAATDEGTTSPPSVSQEEGTTTDDGTTAPEDCPEGARGPRGGTGTPPDSTTPDSSTTPESGTASGATGRQTGRSTATRKSASGVNGRRSQVDSSRSGSQPASRTSVRNSSKA
jgi:cytoskeletal protein RodZ